jgi:hypothetical protein
VDVRITTDPAVSKCPSLVWTGSEYGASWHDDRDGNFEIYFARISATGSKVGTDVRITNDPAESGSFNVLPCGTSLAWTGSEFGVVWSDDRGSGSLRYDIYFNRIGYCE